MTVIDYVRAYIGLYSAHDDDLNQRRNATTDWVPRTNLYKEKATIFLSYQSKKISVP